MSRGSSTPSTTPTRGRRSGAMSQEVYDGLRRRGIPEVAARGAAAGVEAESRSDPTIRGPITAVASGAQGLGQWLGPRRDALRKRYGPKPSFDQQLDFLVWELRGGDMGGGAVLAAKTPEAALSAYIHKFMRPAKGTETSEDMRRGRVALGLPPGPAGTTPHTVSGSRVVGSGTPHQEVKVPTIDETRNGNTHDLFGATGDALEAARRVPKPVRLPRPSSAETVQRALRGGADASFMETPVDYTGANPDAPLVAADRREEAAAAADRATVPWGSISNRDQFAAAWGETLFMRTVDAIGRQSNDYDQAWLDGNKDNWQKLEEFTQTDEELDRVREATSQADYDYTVSDIMKRREASRLIEQSGSPTLTRLGAGVLDPTGWALGFGVGKVGQVLGVGSHVLAASGRPLAAIGSAMVEGGIGDLAYNAGLDISGEYVTAQDYTLGALVGSTIGLGIGGLQVRGVRKGRLQEELELTADTERAVVELRRANAVAELGPDATPEALIEHGRAAYVKEHAATLEIALAPIPAKDRLLVADDFLTDDKAVLQDITTRHDLAGVADTTERSLVAEGIARAETADAALPPVDRDALKTVLAAGNQEAISGRLLLSESAPARMWARRILENPQGAAGRNATAAIAMQQRRRLYNQALSGWDKLEDTFVRQEGISTARNYIDGSGTAAFDRRVMLEIERRGGDRGLTIPEQSPTIHAAADLWERAKNVQRLDQQFARTVGSENLGPHSTGYVDHRLDPAKIEALSANKEAMKGLRAALGDQFEQNMGFDPKFAHEVLAPRYVAYALEKAKGGYRVPLNLMTGEGGEVVKDILQGLKLAPEEFERMIGKYARGGASHTKHRLKLDLSADIGGGKQLVDVFVTDLPALHRASSHRVAGEVAMAQYGIMGKEGAKMYRMTLEYSGATPHEMKAFDQSVAEMFNTPFGDHGFQWMDDLSHIVTAAKLGGMGYNQAGEFGNAIVPLGVEAVTRAIKEFPAMVKEARILGKGGSLPDSFLHDIDTLGGQQGSEGYHVTRAFDISDRGAVLYGSESMGIVSRFARDASHKVAVASGHRLMMAGQIRGLSQQIGRKAVRMAREGINDVHLKDMGFSDEMLEALRKDLPDIADFDAQGNVVGNLRLRNGKALTPALARDFVQAVNRGSSQIIQGTYVGETGMWAHHAFLRFLFKFRTFGIISLEKQWGRNVRKGGGGLTGAGRSALQLIVAMSFAAPIHLARVSLAAQAKAPGKERDEYLEKNTGVLAIARATTNYASASGFLGEIMDVGVAATSSYGGDFGDDFGEAYGVRPGGVAPAYGYTTDLVTGILGGDLAAVVKSAPGSNLPYVAPLLNWGLRQIQEDPVEKAARLQREAGTDVPEFLTEGLMGQDHTP